MNKSIAFAMCAVGVLSAPPVYLYAQAASGCLPISDVVVRGATQLDMRSVDTTIAPFEGQCLGLADFNAAMEAVTALYIDAGLITSRIYLPEQDLTTGILQLTTVEGTIETVAFNGSENRLWERVTFPYIRGRVANLREIEQGLDNIRGMPSYQGVEMALDPGSETGTSVLQVSAKPDPRPYRLSFSTDNYGFKGSGEFNPSFDLAWDNVLSVNDVWTFNYTSAVDRTPFAIGETGDTSQQAAIGITIPYGKWNYSFNQSWSAYTTTIPGAISTIPGDGYSFTTTINARRLLHRDDLSKTHFVVDVMRSQNENFIQDIRIDSSSRVLAALGHGVSHQRSFGGGQLSGTARLEQGIKAFGAEDGGTRPVGQPEAQYSLALLNGDFYRNWPIEAPIKGRLDWTSTAKFQYSPNRLYGGQQFSIGGNATLRGSKIALATGSSGVFWRNELAYMMPSLTGGEASTRWIGAPEIYVGVETGRVFKQDSINVLGGSALGVIYGLRATGGHISLDIGWAGVVRVSDALQKPEGNLRVALTLSY